MAVISNLFVNLYLLVRNLVSSSLRRRADFVWIEVRDGLPEFSSRPGFLRRRLRPANPSLSLAEIRQRLRLLSENADEDGLPGVVLRVRGLAAGWASVEELRREVLAYRERGGRVVAYLVEAGVGPYYLASAADEIAVTPLTGFDVTGIRTSATFLKEALARVGVEAEVVAVSPYKAAYDRFTRDDFSEESRAQAERLLERRYEELVGAISVGRGLSERDVKQRIDEAPFTATEAVQRGLFDHVCYEDELPERLAAGDVKRVEVSEWGSARKALRTPYRKRARKKVGVVTLSGLIMRGRSRNLPLPVPFVGGEQAGDETVVGALRRAERDTSVGAVLFHVDSGGGDALASDLIWREVARLRRSKPVVVLMGNVAASGGYYVGAAADHVVARRTTVTGSIGVISLRPIAVELYEKLGVSSVSLQRGARAGMLDPSRRPTPDELSTLEGQIRSIYAEFKERVSSGRGVESGRLEEIAGGRVWSGAEAANLGLIDEVGGFAEALARARELGGIDSDGPESLVMVAPPKGERPAPAAAPDSMFEVAEALRVGLGTQMFEELLKTRTLAMAPYEIGEGF